MDAANTSERARVLLADDHVLVAQGVEMLLLECFCNIQIVSDGEALIAAVQRDAPDVVVSDISMAGVSGLEAMRALRAQGIDDRRFSRANDRRCGGFGGRGRAGFSGRARSRWAGGRGFPARRRAAAPS